MACPLPGKSSLDAAIKPPFSPCVHCGRYRRLRRRRLCYSCYETPSIRQCYPILCGTRTGPLSPRRKLLPRVPTCARPGSEEKILVLQERAFQGEHLFHPQDAGL